MSDFFAHQEHEDLIVEIWRAEPQGTGLHILKALDREVRHLYPNIVGENLVEVYSCTDGQILLVWETDNNFQILAKEKPGFWDCEAAGVDKREIPEVMPYWHSVGGDTLQSTSARMSSRKKNE